MWVFGGSVVDATTAALVVVSGLVVTRTVSWDDLLANKPAWNTLIWFGTLVTLASGLAQVGMVKWLAGLLSGQLAHLPVVPALVALVAAFFLLHYLFASLTAHTTALLPTMLVVAAAIPGMNVLAAALALSMTTWTDGDHYPVSPPGQGRSTPAAGICRQRTSGGWARSSAPSV